MKEKLAIIIVEKKALGHICVPYIINVEKAPIYNIVEKATPLLIESRDNVFSETELYIINELHRLNEQALLHKFSKEKSVKSFYEKLNSDFVDKALRPYIDTITANVLPLIIKCGLPIILKNDNYNSFYESDHIIASQYPDITRFHFGLTDDGDLIYSLKIANNGQEMNLFKKKIIELTSSPATFIYQHRLYHFQNIDIKKFRPFVQRNSILVPKASVKKYMETFVTQSIMHHYVIAHGFRIIKGSSICIGVLRLEFNITGYNLALYFKYNKKRYPYGNTNKHVELDYTNDKYTFYTFPRNISEEKQILLLLNDIGLHIYVNNILTCDECKSNSSPDSYIKWLNDKSSYLAEHNINVEIENNSSNFYYGSFDLRVDIDDKIDWFDINGIVVFEDVEIPFYKFKSNILNNDPYFHLPDGRVFIIPDEWFTTWSDIFSFVTEQDKSLQLDKMHASLIPDDYAELENISTDLIISNTQRQGALKATLRPYQEEGFKWMNTLYENKRGGILADDMGLGKTVQTLALLSHIYETAPMIENAKNNGLNNTQYPASLIVMPVSLIHNWINEIKKFAPHLKTYNYSGRKRLRSEEIGSILKHYHIVITSYGLLRNDSCYLSNYNFHYIILDESQNIKNPSSKIYHAIRELKGAYRLTISGTPIENSLKDLWAQMNFTNPGLLGNLTFFRNQFETPISKGKDSTKEEKLKKITAPFILRRTKEMVAHDLPPITFQTVYCPMSEEQQNIYDKEKSSFINDIWGKTEDAYLRNHTSFMAMQALTRLRLIANHPILVDPNYNGNSGKFDLIIERIKHIVSEGHKMLIFSSFVKDLNLISNELSTHNLGHCMLTGSTKDREQVINTFNNSDDKNIFLISLKAGGVGLNLTSADYVFVLNPWWNPQAEAQAINRAHRIGQTKNVFVYRFISEGSIEEKIDKLQNIKRDLADNFITSNNPLTDLTEDEIKELFY